MDPRVAVGSCGGSELRLHSALLIAEHSKAVSETRAILSPCYKAGLNQPKLHLCYMQDSIAICDVSVVFGNMCFIYS
jgi:hypothetical protein